MESKLIYKDKEQELCDDFIDIGYMAENVEVTDIEGNTVLVKRSTPDRVIQLFISVPSVEDEFKDDLLALDEFLSGANIELNSVLFLNEKQEIDTKFNSLKIFFDTDDEFGNMYGTKIVKGSLEDKLTKALFLIGKDGAVYFIDMPTDLSTPFNIERLRIEINKVYQSYTGVGCHG